MIDDVERRQRVHRQQNESVKKRRRDLIEDLAPDLACAECGDVVENASLLEVDHVDGIGWSHRALSSSARVSRYWRERRAGVAMRAVCRSCNARDGRRRQLAINAAVERRSARG